MLLNTHLDTFRRRYAYHLRRWALEGKSFGSHSSLRNDGVGPPIRVILQPGGLPDKTILHLHTTDLVADLKAEIAKWWEALQGGAKTSGATAPVLGLLLSEGPLRIITQGQEITAEYDERSLADVGFKDNQMVYVSLGGRGGGGGGAATGGRRREPNDHPSLQPPPPKECLPTLLLLQPKYFEELFQLMQTLGDMKLMTKSGSGGGGPLQPHTKAQLLSRRVWDILAMLPTNPDILDRFKFKDVSGGNAPVEPDYFRDIQDLLDPMNLQKFMYSLHIVESLSKAKQTGCCVNDGKLVLVKGKMKQKHKAEARAAAAKQKAEAAAVAAAIAAAAAAIKCDQIDGGGGNTDNSSKQEATAKVVDDEIKLDVAEPMTIDSDALSESATKSAPVDATMITQQQQQQLPPPAPVAPAAPVRWTDLFIRYGGLRHLFDIFMSGMLQSKSGSVDDFNEWRNDCLASLLRILCLLGVEEMKPEDSLLTVPQLNDHMLKTINPKQTLRRLSSILTDAGLPTNPHHFKTGFWGRSQVSNGFRFSFNFFF